MLSNLKQVGQISQHISSTIAEYKEYFDNINNLVSDKTLPVSSCLKVDKLEDQFLKMNILLHQTFNQAFAQIIDLNAQLSDNDDNEQKENESLKVNIPV